jgi:hypothetical protein
MQKKVNSGEVLVFKKILIRICGRFRLLTFKTIFYQKEIVTLSSLMISVLIRLNQLHR